MRGEVHNSFTDSLQVFKISFNLKHLAITTSQPGMMAKRVLMTLNDMLRLSRPFLCCR